MRTNSFPSISVSFLSLFFDLLYTKFLIKFNLSLDENNCPKCQEVLDELEHIDAETDNLDITFVKIRDTRYARKYGVNKLPAMVYFRRRFPSIYRGDLMAEQEVLDWLQKNRFKQPELNLFMYALGGITSAFVFYTIFLLFCFKGPHQKTA